MSLRINQNISAMQGHYYMQMNESTFNKQIERLSSGLRINRAADDPAGLVISEKYRAQVDGLSQAINNAKDGIGMVQTAEGALDEATKLLRGMRNLALHAANLGPNDTAAIQADQDQITSEIESLTRIADRTKFGSKTLLDGSLGLDGTATDSNVAFVSGTSDTKAGTYAITGVTAATQGVAKTDTLMYTTETITDSSNIAATAGGTINIINSDPSININKTFTIAAGSDLDDIAAQISADSTLAAAGFSATVVNGDDLKLSSSKTGDDYFITVTAGASNLGTIMGSWGGGGTISIGTAAVDATTAGTIKFGSAENLFFKDTASGNVAQVSITTDDTISGALTKIQNALTAKSINVTAAFDATSHKLTFTDGQYGSTSTIQMMHSGAARNSNLGITATAAYVDLADGGSYGGTDGANVSGNINGQAATGSGTTLTLNVDGDDADGLSVSVTGTTAGDRGQITVSNNNLTFQVGAFAGQTVSTQISSVKATALGTGTGTGTASVALIDVTTATGAQDAIAVLDEAISDISTMRGKLGSFQKDVLESTVNNLGVAKTNLSSSESLIRDADMAQEMLTFSKAQILQQTGMAMLAQANSAPQQIMSLFRG